MKSYQICLATFLLFFTSCTNIQEHGTSKPECATPRECLVIRQSKIPCCSKVPGMWVVDNKNSKKDIIALFLREVKKANEEWIEDGTVFKKIIHGTTKEIGCSWGDQSGGCSFPVRYTFSKGCFDGSGDCDDINDIPSNADLPKLNCLNTCQSKSDTCETIDFSKLPAAQKAAIREIYKILLHPKQDYEFQNLIMQAFLPSPKDQLCLDRKSGISNFSFSSFGSDCEITPLLPKPKVLLGTKETYQKLWVKFPSVIKGSISQSANQGYLNFDLKTPRTIWVTVELMSSHKYRQDLIQSIIALDQEKELIISGKDFICLTISNIDVE